MNNTIDKTSKLEKFSIFIFGIFTLFWIYSYFFTEYQGKTFEIFANTYGIMALYGGVVGVIAANKWGGFKSIFGKALILLSIGLLFQEIGQIFYSYYIFVRGIDIPYPSLGDIGFFGSVILYIGGSIFLMKATGVTLSIKDAWKEKLLAFFIPAIMFFISYYFLIGEYEIGSEDLLTTVLNLGYPLFQAIYVSIAMIIYLISRKTIGDGKIIKHIIFLLIALFVQYIADFTFLFKSKRELYVAGGFSDYIYLLAYFFMSLAIIKLGKFFDNLKSS